MSEFSEAATPKHGYTNPSKKQDLGHLEAVNDKDVKYDKDGNQLDKHGFKVKVYPDGVTSVFKSVVNCEQMASLEKNLMARIIAGEWKEYSTLNSLGRQSQKIVIEYDIKQKEDDT